MIYDTYTILFQYYEDRIYRKERWFNKMHKLMWIKEEKYYSDSWFQGCKNLT